MRHGDLQPTGQASFALGIVKFQIGRYRNLPIRMFGPHVPARQGNASRQLPVKEPRADRVNQYLTAGTRNFAVDVELPAVIDGEHCIQIIQMGDDLGTQVATQLSPEMYREYVKPRHEAIYQYVREHSNLTVFLHSCGSIYKLIPDLIDAGVEILNPVQTSAAHMDPRRLKDEFGDQLTFWGGGCDTQTVLPTATPEEVREHVRERMEIFKPGGGFVFNQIHNVQPNVPPENVVAMLDAAYEYGG